ncbi:unnamed protein product [Tuber aestivum]|uniref:Growth hormone-inducible transmembrane protein n=1 Tax=Tuber aestivum TaxID=59557 RepID=A0A292Q432_9PEZI|nr:unnamed protein product [Tuber aestivum]
MFLQSTIRPVAGRAPFLYSVKPFTRTFATLRPPVLRQAITPVRHQQATKAQFATKRFYTTDPDILSRPTGKEKNRDLLYAGLLFGSAIFFTNILYNLEPREGGIPPYERAYVHETFTYTGLGVGMVGLAAKGLHNMGWSYKLMSKNPWLVLGGSLVAAAGTMYATKITDPDNYIQKHLLWSAFNLTSGAVLAPLFFYNPALLSRVGVYAAGIMGSVALAGATAIEGDYLYFGGPSLALAAMLALSGLGPIVLPLGSRALLATESFWMCGGLGAFAGFTLYGPITVMDHAIRAKSGLIQKDTVNESIDLELDFIITPVRLVQTLVQRQQNQQ